VVDTDSTLTLYRLLLRERRNFGLGREELRWADTGSEDVLAFTNDHVTVVANFGPTSVHLSKNDPLIIRSAGAGQEPVGPDTTVWLRSNA